MTTDERIDQLLDRIAKLEEEVKYARRGEDYRQIMNAIAGHCMCYNAHEQKYEIDHYWTKTKDDCWYNRNSTPIGVETYYVNNTRALRTKQANIANRVYGKNLTEKDKVGYRVMNMLTTPYIEIAGDGQTAQGVWFVFNIQSHLDENGIPAPDVFTNKMCAEFCKENGQWKLWRFRFAPGGFDLDVNLTNTGLNPNEIVERNKRLCFGFFLASEEEKKLLHQRDLVWSYDFEESMTQYCPWLPLHYDPHMPEPYETYADAVPFFVLKDEEETI